MAERAESDAASDSGGRTPQQTYKHWSAQLELAHKDHKGFIDAGRNVIQRYKSCKDKAAKKGGKRLNILYSNTEHLRSALYGKSAVPDVRRRFGQEDKVGTQAAEIIEKALVYCQETYDSDRPIELAILDYLLPGRGTVRVEYEPVLSGPEGSEQISEQHLRETYVFWEDFRVSPARTWSDVMKDGAVFFRHTMDRQDLRDNFEAHLGSKVEDVPLNWQPEMAERREIPDSMKKAEVWEIWDAATKKRYWIVPGFPEPLRIDDDPLGLEGFFPLPEPPAYYQTTDTVIPEPEFHVYMDQADDLDEIVARISKLTKALKRRGVYDQSVKELSRLANAGDNQFIPVENYAALATKGGLAAAFQSEDLSVIAQVLLQLYQQRDMLVAQIWEIVGIGDIQRGSSDPNETLGAQQLKAQFGGQRMMRRQRTIQKWVRDLLKIKAEILAEHFEPQILMQMTGVFPDPADPESAQVIEQAFQLLKSDKMRGYRIDIETDSTVFEDAESEKKSVSEALGAITQFMATWGPMVQQQPELGPLAFELLKFGLKGFKATRAIEDAIEDAARKLEEMAQQPKPPSPEEAKLQAEQAKMEGEMQFKQADAQIKAQSEQQRLVFEQQKHEQEMAFKREEHEMTMGLEREKMAMEQASRAQDFEFKQAEASQNREFKSQEMAQTREMHDQTLQHQTDERELNDTREREKVGLPANPNRQVKDSLAQVLQTVMQAQEAITASAQEQREASEAQMKAAAAQQQMAQALIENIAALSKDVRAPRRRTPVRDEKSGRILYAEDRMVQ
jgi:hypothetical protein